MRGYGHATFLSERGCLPVSAMIPIPAAPEVRDEQGALQRHANAENWRDYMGRTFAQPAWWAGAAARHRDAVDPQSRIKPFGRPPSQRNAPGEP